MIKAIFFDIDGTITKDLVIPSSFKTSLKKLKEKGIKCIISTGRHQIEIDELNLLEDLEFDAYLTMNGGYCRDHNHHVFHHIPIHKKDIEHIVSQIKETPYPIMFIEKDLMYMSMIDDHTIEAQKAVHLTPPEVLNIERALENDIYQMIYFGDSDAPLTVANHLKMTKWHPYGYDIIPENSGKSGGIKACLDYYGLTKEETMAFGDGMNDIDMLQFVEIGVALGNANDEVKASADYVTTDIHDDGVYNALVHFKII